MNMASLVLMHVLVGHHFPPRQWLAVMLTCCLGVSVGLYLLNPWIEWYVGFSGTLYGILVAGLCAEIYRTHGRQRLIGALLLACMIAKLVWEQVFGATPGSAEMAGGPVIVDSHLYGCIAGAVAIAVILLAERSTGRSN